MTEKIEKIAPEDVEIVHSPEEIIRVKADEDGNNSEIPSVEEFLKKMKENGNGENPLFQMADTMVELKKVKVYFFISLLVGFFGLFADDWGMYMGVIAIFFGALDLQLGSRLTKNAAYVGIVLGLLDLVLFFS